MAELAKSTDPSFMGMQNSGVIGPRRFPQRLKRNTGKEGNGWEDQTAYRQSPEGNAWNCESGEVRDARDMESLLRCSRREAMHRTLTGSVREVGLCKTFRLYPATTYPVS